MILTITLRRHPATDLGFLLHKHPAKVQEVEIKSGKAHIFYPKATDDETACSLLLDIDPVELVRGANANPRGDTFALEQYVNDRPYVASSFLSSAIAKAYSSALNGNCNNRPELPGEILPLGATIAVVPVRGDAGSEGLLQRLFGPLGYEMIVVQHPLDEMFPSWGDSRYHTVTLRGNLRLQELLAHLYVLLPVLDGDKHYWVGQQEVDKLLEKGKGWLEAHPEKGLIINRYLRHQKSLAAGALGQLAGTDNLPSEEVVSTEQLNVATPETVAEEAAITEENTGRKPRLHDARLQTVADALVASGARSVIDLGCGEGKLLRILWTQSQIRWIAGMDVAPRPLEFAADKLNLHRMDGQAAPRLQLFQGSLMYADARLRGYDAAALVEVIEHMDEDRLATAAGVVFGDARPKTVIVTTPNREWNKIFGEETDRMRHTDHRFEWTRAEFAAWCEDIGNQYNYRHEIRPVGEETPEWGAPTQMGVFTMSNE